MAADEVAAGRRLARDERIAGETARALADGHVVADGALSVNAARCRARIDASEVVAHLVARALGVVDTFGTATSSVGIALVTGTALADGAEAASETVGVGTAREVGAGVVAAEAVAARETAAAAAAY